MKGLLAGPTPRFATQNPKTKLEPCLSASRSDGHLLHDLEPIPIEAHDLSRAVRQQTDLAETERNENLRADAVIAKAHRRRRLAGLGGEAVHEGRVGVRRLHVE